MSAREKTATMFISLLEEAERELSQPRERRRRTAGPGSAKPSLPSTRVNRVVKRDVWETDPEIEIDLSDLDQPAPDPYRPVHVISGEGPIAPARDGHKGLTRAMAQKALDEASRELCCEVAGPEWNARRRAVND